MKVVTYLHFDGNCAEAFRLYEAVLGGRIVDMLPHAGTPASEHVPAGWQDKIMHAYMLVGDTALMASDIPPDHFVRPQGMSVSLHVDDEAEAERVFAALAEGGNVTMPLEATFWSRRFGMLVDRFGTPWMINCALPAA